MEKSRKYNRDGTLAPPGSFELYCDGEGCKNRLGAGRMVFVKDKLKVYCGLCVAANML